LYFSEGTNIKSAPFLDTTSSVIRDATYTFADTKRVWFSKYDAGMPTMKKLALRIKGITEGCSDYDYITIVYKIDDAVAVLFGGFVKSPYPDALPFTTTVTGDGIAFYEIQLAVYLDRYTTTTNSPKLLSLDLEYIPLPPALYGWQMRVRCQSNLIGSYSGKYLIDSLIAAYEAQTLIPFVPDLEDGTSYNVRVVGMPGREGGGEFGRDGIYVVQVQEVI